MSTDPIFTIDRNEFVGLALVSDKMLSHPRYVPLAEAPEERHDIFGSYLSQCHTVASIERAKAIQGLFVVPYRDLGKEPGWDREEDRS